MVVSPEADVWSLAVMAMALMRDVRACPYAALLAADDSERQYHSDMQKWKRDMRAGAAYQDINWLRADAPGVADLLGRMLDTSPRARPRPAALVEDARRAFSPFLHHAPHTSPPIAMWKLGCRT